jgi:hypothetical protein
MDRKSGKSESKSVDKSPFMRGSEKKREKAFKSVEKSVNPVARDTNKTRRTSTKARKVGPTVPKELPVSSQKKKSTNEPVYKGR